jgi:ribosome-associated protein YbcJ (S4-like RNA binding protein)
MIAESLVKVDGVVELRKRFKMREGHVAELDDKKVKVIL